MMYQQYPEIRDLYVLHREVVDSWQGGGSSLKEIIKTGNNKEELIRLGEEMFPAANRSGWSWDCYTVVVNTSLLEGQKMWEEQQATWKQQWEDVDTRSEWYKNNGYTVSGNREYGGPIVMKLYPLPELDNPQEMLFKNSSYQYIVFDVSDKITEDGRTE